MGYSRKKIRTTIVDEVTFWKIKPLDSQFLTIRAVFIAAIWFRKKRESQELANPLIFDSFLASAWSFVDTDLNWTLGFMDYFSWISTPPASRPTAWILLHW